MGADRFTPAPANSALAACSRPSSRNAVTSDSSVRIVRVFLRQSVAQMRGRNFISSVVPAGAPPPSPLPQGEGGKHHAASPLAGSASPAPPSPLPQREGGNITLHHRWQDLHHPLPLREGAGGRGTRRHRVTR